MYIIDRFNFMWTVVIRILQQNVIHLMARIYSLDKKVTFVQLTRVAEDYKAYLTVA